MLNSIEPLPKTRLCEMMGSSIRTPAGQLQGSKMNKARILLVGDYPALLETRALILKDWETASADSSGALSTIHSGSFDVILIGQSISVGMAIEIIAAAKASNPPSHVIVIRFPEDDTDFGVETHKTDLGAHPSWLRERVAFLLAKRSTAD
jgi:CheY-like chemotaxis protein